ncbi:MAG TPA: hypothetical protein VKB23_10830 [Solirubrobacterales bacterium]|nr:hypothetical protein [Solirubrobacterales bacterium]
MKAGRLLGVLACALAALLLPAGAIGAGLPKGAISLSTIKLGESNGYELELVGLRLGKRRPGVVITAQRETASASYSVRTGNGPGIHATFGSLGQVALGFHRRKKVVERPERNCRWIIEVGVFRGSVNFVGEGGYITSEARKLKGVIFRLPDGFCGLGSFRPGLPPGLPRETVLAARMETRTGEVSFRASRERSARGTIQFNASTKERVEGMRIERSVRVPGEQGAFTATGTSRATVSPPSPFSGYAGFRDPKPGPVTWEGPLAVTLPGLAAIPLAGEGFTARLCPSLSILASCLPKRERARIGSRYGSGSHSQPLALARLSSLR